MKFLSQQDLGYTFSYKDIALGLGIPVNTKSQTGAITAWCSKQAGRYLQLKDIVKPSGLHIYELVDKDFYKPIARSKETFPGGKPGRKILGLPGKAEPFPESKVSYNPSAEDGKVSWNVHTTCDPASQALSIAVQLEALANFLRRPLTQCSDVELLQELLSRKIAK